MIDIHAHILPEVDDGSGSLDESLGLLRMLAAQGVSLTAATPHFYADTDAPERFFARREAAWQRLSDAMTPELPRVLLGAELAYYRGVAQMQELERFCIGGGRLLLLELPFEPWPERMLMETVEIAERGITVVLAHVERYFAFQRRGVWSWLSERGVLMQSNATALLQMRTAGRVERMMRRGMICFLASDCHNLSTRPPRLYEAAARMEKRLGADFTAEFFRTEERILQEGCAAYA